MTTRLFASATGTMSRQWLISETWPNKCAAGHTSHSTRRARAETRQPATAAKAARVLALTVSRSTPAAEGERRHEPDDPRPLPVRPRRAGRGMRPRTCRRAAEAQRPVPDVRRPAARTRLLWQPACQNAKYRRTRRRRCPLRAGVCAVSAVQPVAIVAADRALSDDDRRPRQSHVVRRAASRLRLAAAALQGERLRHAPLRQDFPRRDRRRR